MFTKLKGMCDVERKSSSNSHLAPSLDTAWYFKCYKSSPKATLEYVTEVYWKKIFMYMHNNRLSHKPVVNMTKKKTSQKSASSNSKLLLE